jgi:molybdopterin converting factor small subunit
MAIAVEVRLNAILQKYSPIGGQSSFRVSLPEESCIEDAIGALELPREKVGLAAINNRVAEFSSPLAEGDMVILFPRLPYEG